MKRILYSLLIAAAFGGAAQASQAPPVVCVMDGCSPAPASQQQ